MDQDALATTVLKTRFPSIIRKYSTALTLGVVTEADLLSDYQLGVARALPNAKERQGEVSGEDYVHYRGLCEVERQFRLRRQKGRLNVCDRGHTYSYHKHRLNCPKCGSAFKEEQKFHVLDDALHLQTHLKESFDLDDLKKAVELLPIPPKQKRIFKVLIGNGLFLEEEHAITKTAKLVGVSRVRVAKVVRDNRSFVRQVLVAEGFLSC